MENSVMSFKRLFVGYLFSLNYCYSKFYMNRFVCCLFGRHSTSRLHATECVTWSLRKSPSNKTLSISQLFASGFLISNEFILFTKLAAWLIDSPPLQNNWNTAFLTRHSILVYVFYVRAVGTSFSFSYFSYWSVHLSC